MFLVILEAAWRTLWFGAKRVGGIRRTRYITILCIPLDDAYFGWKIEKDPILIGKLKGASFRGGETA